MNQNIFNNILLLLIILVLIRHISPNYDSVLYVIKKYLNFIIFKIKSLFYQIINKEYEDFRVSEFKGKTFSGISTFNDKSPNFVSPHQVYWVEYIVKNNILVKPIVAKKLYHFIETLVSIDSDDYFMSASNIKEQTFTESEINVITNIILNKLNGNEFKFTDFKLLKIPKYHINLNGKEVEPFKFSVICDNNIGLLTIYIEISIRNDVIRNFDYIHIKKIRLLVDTINKTNINNKTNYSENPINNNSENPINYSENPINYSENPINYSENPINNSDKKITPQNNDELDVNWAGYSDNYTINYNDNNIPNYLYTDHETNQTNYETNMSSEINNMFSY